MKKLFCVWTIPFDIDGYGTSCLEAGITTYLVECDDKADAVKEIEKAIAATTYINEDGDTVYQDPGTFVIQANEISSDSIIKASLTSMTKKINCTDLYQAIQDFLGGENGSPLMNEPYRDSDGDIVFADYNGVEFYEHALLDWYLSLVEDELIADSLEIKGVSIELVDDYDWLESDDPLDDDEE